jgi:hypothetical protein
MNNPFDSTQTYDNTYQGQRDMRTDHNAAMGLLGAKAPQTQNVGGFAVAPSATEQMAHALRQYGAMRQFQNTMPNSTPMGAQPLATPTTEVSYGN